MMRSLWTAASGMIAQQQSLDNISNNIANVNTVGYKTQTAEFKSLLYQNLQSETTTANADPKPINAEVGLGTRLASITTQFTQGAFTESESDTDFALEGKGFFAVRGVDGNTYYTRNGHFQLVDNGSGGLMLTNSDGLAVLDTNGNAIELDAGCVASKVTITTDGKVYYPDADGKLQDLGMQFGLFQFNNPAGLTKMSESLYAVSASSGEAMNEATDENLDKTKVVQGYLEASNVQLADEMVNMIVTQRAYEMNSKAIQASDTMLEQANNLRR